MKSPWLKYLRDAEKCLKTGRWSEAKDCLLVVVRAIEKQESAQSLNCSYDCDTCELSSTCKYNGGYGKPIWLENFDHD